MAIRYNFENRNLNDFSDNTITAWIKEVVTRRGMTVGNINYLFCDDAYLLKINLQYLNHDTYTDIITFDYVHGSLVSGDILISIDRVEENARKYNVSFEQELHRVIIHGVLHLLGQGDKSEEEAQEMRRQETDALSLYAQMFHKEHNS